MRVAAAALATMELRAAPAAVYLRHWHPVLPNFPVLHAFPAEHVTHRNTHCDCVLRASSQYGQAADGGTHAIFQRDSIRPKFVQSPADRVNFRRVCAILQTVRGSNPAPA